MSQTADRLAELGIVLPKPATPAANYAPFVMTGGPLMTPGAGTGEHALLWVSGQLPFGPDGKLAGRHTGKLGEDSPIEPAREAARLCAINLIAQAQAAVGDLDWVVRVVRLGGFFNVSGPFDSLPQARNGASDLMAEVFGERGKHARMTVGVAHLPMNALVAVEAQFEIAV